MKEIKDEINVRSFTKEMSTYACGYDRINIRITILTAKGLIYCLLIQRTYVLSPV